MTRREGNDMLTALKEFQVEVMRRLDELAGLPGQVGTLSARVGELAGLPRQVNSVSAQVNEIDARLTDVERRLVRLDDRMSDNHQELLAAIRAL